MSENQAKVLDRIQATGDEGASADDLGISKNALKCMMYSINMCLEETDLVLLRSSGGKKGAPGRVRLYGKGAGGRVRSFREAINGSEQPG